jgi:hypothetical protein
MAMPRNLVGHAVAILMLGGCALLGAMALAAGVAGLFRGEMDIGQFALALVAGTLFGGAGLGGLYALYGHQHLYPMWQRWIFQKHADRPWERKREWRTGRIRHKRASAAWCLGLFAIGWNAGVAAVLWGNRDLIAAQARESWPSVLPAALFPLIGLAVLYAAVRSLLAPRHACRAVFVMASVPAWTGGELEGSVETRVPAGMRRFARLKFGPSTGTPMEAEVAPGALLEGTQGLVIPVRFPIGAGAAPTDEFDPKCRNIWTLEIRMKLPREELRAQFQVPVYRRPSPE